MAFPSEPDLDYSYADFAQSVADGSFPGGPLDNDLANLAQSIVDTLEFIKLHTRSDGQLKNKIVTIDSLSDPVLALLGLGPSGSISDIVNACEAAAVAAASSAGAAQVSALAAAASAAAAAASAVAAAASAADALFQADRAEQEADRAEAAAELAEGAPGAQGYDGWTPVISAIVDGARKVLRITDWTGGTGSKPATGKYVGSGVLVDTAAEAVDILAAAAKLKQYGISGTAIVDDVNLGGFLVLNTVSVGAVSGWRMAAVDLLANRTVNVVAIDPANPVPVTLATITLASGSASLGAIVRNVALANPYALGPGSVIGLSCTVDSFPADVWAFGAEFGVV